MGVQGLGVLQGPGRQTSDDGATVWGDRGGGRGADGAAVLGGGRGADGAAVDGAAAAVLARTVLKLRCWQAGRTVGGRCCCAGWGSGRRLLCGEAGEVDRAAAAAALA